MTRSRFQGLRNIIAFNWPYYAVALVLVAGLLLFSALAPSPWSGLLVAATIVVAFPTLTSILASIWIYDLSGLYGLRWLDDDKLPRIEAVLVLNAGFDEISDEIRALHPDADLLVVDFHDPVTTTEPSIERARKVQTGSGDILAVKATDLRDLANFLAYSVGFRHFHSRREWQRTFAGAGLAVRREFAHTPFIRVSVLGRVERWSVDPARPHPRPLPAPIRLARGTPSTEPDQPSDDEGP